MIVINQVILTQPVTAVMHPVTIASQRVLSATIPVRVSDSLVPKACLQSAFIPFRTTPIENSCTYSGTSELVPLPFA
jgi:hypothetical protein